jgi:hypothetical protein
MECAEKRIAIQHAEHRTLYQYKPIVMPVEVFIREGIDNDG